MTFEVRLLAKAEKVFRGADRALARKLARCFEQLERDPRQHNNIRRLKGQLAGLYRYRVGDDRVVYAIDDDQRQVTVLLIAHRSEAYE